MAKKVFTALVLVLVMVCGASADLFYRQNDELATDSKYLIHVRPDGTEESTGINLSGGYFAMFRYNGKDYLMAAAEDEYNAGSGYGSYSFKYTTRIAIYDPDNMSTPFSSGDISSAVMDPSSVAELGNNIVIGGESAGASKIIEINPNTCEIVNTYTHYTDASSGILESYVYNWNGTFIASFEAPDTSEYEGFDGVTVTMDTFGHITGTIEDATLDMGVESSGGELYAALGESYNGDWYQNNSDDLGIYRISEAVRSMDTDYIVRITRDNACHIYRDGNGGLYYTVFGSTPRSDSDNSFNVRYIYHWNGNNSSLVYDAGEYSDIDEIYYDINSGMLYVEFDYENGSDMYNAVSVLAPGSSGQFTVSRTYRNAGMMNLTGNPSDSRSPSGGETILQPESSTLPTAAIMPIIISDEARINLTDIIRAVSPDFVSADLKQITDSNLSAPQAPTPSMMEYMRNDGYEPAYRFNTVTVNEDGYYVFAVNIPDELIGTSIDDVKMYALKNADFSDSSAKSSFFGLINGILNYGELTTMTGEKPQTLVGQMLAVGLLQGSQPFSLFIAKVLLALLAGGCSMTGTGAIMSLAVCIMYIMFKH